MPSEHPRLEHHFPNLGVQLRAAQLGMWLFLVTELLLFGALFVGYAYYRYLYPHGWSEASHHLNQVFGTVNTFVLITSSLAVAMGVHFARAGRKNGIVASLGIGAFLGLTFLVIKGFEYAEEVHKGALPGKWYSVEDLDVAGANLFFTLYWIMTGLHGIHVIVGVTVLLVVAYQAFRGYYDAHWHTPVELGGMYWHLVDVIWIFIFPLLYLV